MQLLSTFELLTRISQCLLKMEDEWFLLEIDPLFLLHELR